MRFLWADIFLISESIEKGFFLIFGVCTASAFSIMR